MVQKDKNNAKSFAGAQILSRFRISGLLNRIVILGLVLLSSPPILHAVPIKVLKLTQSEIKYETLQVVDTKTQSLQGLQLWNSIPKEENPEGWSWSSEPDFKEYLLQRGLAKLQDPANSPPHLREAEKAAKQEGLGMWKTTALPESLTSDASAEPETSGSPWIARWKWLPALGKYAVAVVAAIITFVGGWQLIVLLWAYFHRHQVFLILLGEPNTGKTWLWYRMVDPTMSELGFPSRRSDARAKLKHSKIPLGRYEVIPVYEDIPGSRSGEQLTELLDRKWFRSLQRLLIPQKRVWLILLAPAVNSSDGKVNQSDLQLQLGALKLYVGVLASRKAPKPDFVAICIAKADLFMDNPPSDSASKTARDELMRTFHAHTTLLSETCKAHRVKSEIILCSARRAWGTDRIMKALERACFTGR